MVEISLSGSGEGPGWATAPGYSTAGFRAGPRKIGLLSNGAERGDQAPAGGDFNGLAALAAGWCWLAWTKSGERFDCGQGWLKGTLMCRGLPVVPARVGVYCVP
jgi:hypothetical protein